MRLIFMAIDLKCVYFTYITATMTVLFFTSMALLFDYSCVERAWSKGEYTLCVITNNITHNTEFISPDGNTYYQRTPINYYIGQITTCQVLNDNCAAIYPPDLSLYISALIVVVLIPCVILMIMCIYLGRPLDRA
jgi:hypothetical protein